MKKLISLPQKSPFDIKPDTLIFSDLHLHEREEFSFVTESGLNSRLEEGLSILDQINEIKNRPEIIQTIFLGDVFELKDRIPNHILIEYGKRLDRLLTKPHFFLMGNHDYNIQNYTIPEIFNIDRFGFIKETQLFPNRNYGDWGFIPFQRKQEDFIEALNKLNNLNPSVIFFHQELPGGEYESGRKIPGVIPNNLFKPDIVYISGHLHKYQTVGKVVYIGGPYQKNFSDEGCKKFVWLFNSQTRMLASLELSYPKFISIDIGQGISEFPINGNYIRITGEVGASSWSQKEKEILKEAIISAGAKGVSLQVKVKKHHQVKIEEAKIDHDDLIIQDYAKENKGNLDLDHFTKVGLEIFYQN